VLWEIHYVEIITDYIAVVEEVAVRLTKKVSPRLKVCQSRELSRTSGTYLACSLAVDHRGTTPTKQEEPVLTANRATETTQCSLSEALRPFQLTYASVPAWRITSHELSIHTHSYSQ
jgi:hypothetical protein